jgi:NitT/TauT family transport system permease protein
MNPSSFPSRRKRPRRRCSSPEPRASVSMAQAGPAAGRMAEERFVLLGRIVLMTGLLSGWELTGRFVDPTWISMPSLIAARLIRWAGDDLALHAATTVGEMAMGLALGVPGGVLAGIFLGRSPLLATLLRPIIVALYSVPLVTLAPLLILWFGLDMEPKVVLVAVVVFFLIFFNTFSGVQAIDRELIASFTLMGASRREEFQKLILPAASAWILSGLRIALPYALIAATVGEMIAARRGLGFLVTRSASQIDMTGLYAALIVLMLIGVAIGAAANALEAHVLRWRASGR